MGKNRTIGVYDRSDYDKATGMLTGGNTRVVKKFTPNNDKYTFTFHSGAELLGSVGKMETRVFLRMLPRVSFDTGVFTSSARIKRLLGVEVGLSPRSVRHALDGLVVAGLLFREGPQDYVLNPEHFWFGTLDKRQLALVELQKQRDAAPPEANPEIVGFLQDKQTPPHANGIGK